MTNNQQIAERQDELKAAVAERAQNYDLREFLDGQADCRDGKPHESGKSESYDAGYSAQYELQEMMEKIA